MIQAWVNKLLGRSASRFARQHQGIVDAINTHADELRGLMPDQLSARASNIRTQAHAGAATEQLVCETFALVREAADQSLGLRHFDEQLLGGYCLHQGMIAEMKTGEGKTLAATLPACWAALSGAQVHIVTVNDYLAARDADWMQPVYATLGLTVSINRTGLKHEDKLQAYKADIMYGTNNQFGFDHLNDNMIHEPDKRLQHSLDFAIVDEVDSILIDEARTPLSISGVAADLTPLYRTCDALAKSFTPGHEEAQEITGDFMIDDKSRQIHFSDAGYDKAEHLFAERKLLHDGGLYESHNLNLMHHLAAALRARHLYKRDREYVVHNRQVVIVDEHTGRLMPGRRWGDGLHQAIEAKEGLSIEPETQTLASVSIQNYFRMYAKLAGMTGTAQTEAEEFGQIYGLAIAEIPTHRTMIRGDQLDRVYARRQAKLRHAVADILECQARNQPVLVGTTTIETSEELAAMLKKENVAHAVLNAKQHEQEAEIISQAGMPGKVTISTSMAGRGTDIVLGGNIDADRAAIKADTSLTEASRTTDLVKLATSWQERHDQVVAAGGLRIIGTERHESRRIDNQLRGRSGRQGDPGSSVFYLSFEDPLLRVFADAKFSGLLNKLMDEDNDPLEVGMVTRVIEKAQRRMESYNFDIRKQLLEYDDIANDQRRIIYDQRRHIVDSDDIATIGQEFASAAVETILATYMAADTPEEEWDTTSASARLHEAFNLDYPIAVWLAEDEKLSITDLSVRVADQTLTALAANVAKLGPESLRLQKSLILEVIDSNWRQHLGALAHLRQGIGLRGFAHKNPRQEYRREALVMFNSMLETVRNDATRILMAVRLKEGAAPPSPPPPAAVVAHQPAHQPPPKISPQPQQQLPAFGKTKRNAPCPCGSGKKYKHCHGR